MTDYDTLTSTSMQTLLSSTADVLTRRSGKSTGVINNMAPFLSVPVNDNVTASQHARYEDREAQADFINYTCAFLAVTCQSVERCVH